MGPIPAPCKCAVSVEAPDAARHCGTESVSEHDWHHSVSQISHVKRPFPESRSIRICYGCRWPWHRAKSCRGACRAGEGALCTAKSCSQDQGSGADTRPCCHGRSETDLPRPPPAAGLPQAPLRDDESLVHGWREAWKGACHPRCRQHPFQPMHPVRCRNSRSTSTQSELHVCAVKGWRRGREAKEGESRWGKGGGRHHR